MISYKLVTCFFRILKIFFLFTLWAFRMFYVSTRCWNVMIYLTVCFFDEGFWDGAVVKNPPAHVGDARDAGLIQGSRRSPGVGNDKPLQYCCLENSMEIGAWWATVHGVAKESDMTEHIHTHTHTHTHTLFPLISYCSFCTL